MTVLMSRDDYMAEATRKLSNQLNYQKQDTDLTEQFSDEITTTLNDMLR